VVKFKKEELTASILGLMSQYAINYPMATQNPSFKVSKTFKDYEKSLETDNDQMVKKPTNLPQLSAKQNVFRLSGFQLRVQAKTG